MLQRAAILLLAALVASPASAQRRVTAAAPVTIHGSVVLVRAVDNTGGVLVGNGVVIGVSGQIVTERALLEGAASVTVLALRGTTPVTATVMSVDTLTGLALLRAPGLQATPAPVAPGSLMTNDAVIIATIAEDETPSLLRGTVRSMQTFAGSELAMLSTNITAESNGAPVTNTAGEVVGIAFSSEVDGAVRTYVIPSRAFERVNADGLPRQARTTSVTVTQQAAPTPATSSTRSRTSPTRTTTAAPPAATSGSSRFSAAGFEFERTILAIYAGEFQNVELKREEMTFGLLLGAYINSCARQCDAYLPPNKVELMTRECVRERRTVNGYGVQISSYCVEWQDRGTGLYADPAMVAAQRRLESQSIGSNIGEMIQTMTKGNPMAAAGNMIGTVQKIRSDMNALLQRNGCASAGTKRFQENLRRFALREPPLKLSGAEAAAIAAASKPLFSSNIVSANFTKLLDDLIADQATSWMMNRYREGSVSNVSVTTRDSQGRPATVEGRYLFASMNGNAAGSVIVQFSDGIPECMYFFDAPQNCRTPGRKIVASYASGRYAEP